MLEVLRRQELEGVLATVVRYFGGVKLGAGGLVRAYTDAVAQALLLAEKVPRIAQAERSCQVPYAREGWLRRLLAEQGAVLMAVEHGQAVTVRFRLPAPHLGAMVEQVNEQGQGQVVWLKIPYEPKD